MNSGFKSKYEVMKKVDHLIQESGYIYKFIRKSPIGNLTFICNSSKLVYDEKKKETQPCNSKTVFVSIKYIIL